MKVPKINPISVIGAILAAAILSFFGLGYFHMTVPPKNCVLCHNIKGEEITWELSTHSKVKCYKCHKPPTHLVFSWIAHKFSGEKDVPSFKEKSLASACLDCHTLNRQYTGNLKISHRGHESRGVTCIKCHPSVVHARSRDWAEVSWQKSNISLSVSKYHRPPKQVCFSCHEKEVKKETPCTFCHKTLNNPPDHLQPNFLKQHGVMANKSLENCNTCHYAFNDQQLINIGTNITSLSYAANNIFCKKCHNLPADKRSTDLIKKK